MSNKANSIAALYGAMAMMYDSDNILKRSRKDIPDLTPEEIQKLEKRLELKKIEAQREKNIKKGLKEFFYDENSVWAINQKNADKKAKKLGYLINN